MSRSRQQGARIRVFIADISRMSCQLMASAFRRSRYKLRVAGYATDAAGILAGLGENEADVAIIAAELREGAMAGFAATRETRASYPGTRVIMMLDSIGRSAVVEAFRAGASGVYSREDSFELLCKCAYQVSQGQVWAGSEALVYVTEALSRTPPMQAASPRTSTVLTKREEGVVHLVAEGLTNRDISQQLNLSEHTIRNHLFRIFNKVGTSNRLELALYALNRRADDKQPN
jgi:DNA-binding NarL/FixJ family response regulator